MATYLPQEKLDSIFTQYGGNAQNTGSAEGQVALFTYRITSLSAHLKANPKDHSTRRALIVLVGKRRRLLKYLAAKDIIKYRELIAKVGIRDFLK